MRKTRLVGIVLIISSLLLQISYATTVTFADVFGGDYKVSFQKIDYYLNKDSVYVDVNVQKTDDNNLAINVDNLYPGAYFTMRPYMQNYGYKTIKIVGFKLNYISGNDRLFDMIVGVNSDGTEIQKYDYINYLNNIYSGTTLKFGEVIDVMYSMGLSSTVTDFMNERIVFEIIVVFEADEEDNPPDDPPVIPPNKPPVVPTDIPPVTPPDDPPVVPTDIPPVTPPDDPYANTSNNGFIDVSIDSIPIEVIDILPNTGGWSPLMVYSIGFILILFGILLLICDRRKLKL